MPISPYPTRTNLVASVLVRWRAVGAGARVTEGKEFPDGLLIVGLPVRVVRPLDDKTQQRIGRIADNYVKRWQRYAKGLKRIG